MCEMKKHCNAGIISDRAKAYKNILMNFLVFPLEAEKKVAVIDG